MNIPDEPLEAQVLSRHINILRALVLLDEFEFSVASVISYGEQVQNELRQWANQLLSRSDYAGPVTCIPWGSNESRQIIRPTALEVCTVLVRAIYSDLIRERPVLWGSSPDWQVAADRIDEYVKEHHETISRRLVHLHDSINVTEWFRTISLAEIELFKLLNREPIHISTGPVYGMSALLTIIDAEDNETAKAYLKAASLPVAIGRGQREIYTQEQAEQFANQVIANPSRKNHATAASLWLQKQKTGTGPAKIR